jgi:hypothetical protein
VSKRDMSYATSLSSVAQQLALSMGVALGAFALETTAAFHGSSTITANDFAPAFWTVAVISGLSALMFVRLHPDAGAEMSGHKALERKMPSSGMGDGMNNGQ